MRVPKAKECRCWTDYPNPMHKDRCGYYECVKKGNKLTRKTVCKLKSKDNEEKIKNMSTWELAEFIYEVSNNATKISNCNEECEKCEGSDSWCISNIAEWLKEQK